MPWLNRAPADQNLILPDGDAASDDARVLVVNHAAGRAGVARQMITIGDPDFDGLTAAGAILHGAGMG